MKVGVDGDGLEAQDYRFTGELKLQALSHTLSHNMDMSKARTTFQHSPFTIS